MRFFEFEDDFDYYALIGAKNEAAAINLYTDAISEIEEDWQEPKEVKQEYAYKRLIDSCVNNRQKRGEILNFRANMQGNEAFLILIDGDLL